MTPQEKAKELIKRFYPMTYTAVHAQNRTGEYADAEKCALIAVDEIMIEYKVLMIETAFCYDQFKYWEQVKQEIEKL